MVTPEPETPVTFVFSITPTAASWASAALLRALPQWRGHGLRHIPSQVGELASLLNAIRVMEGQGGSAFGAAVTVGHARDMPTVATESEPAALSYADTAARLRVSLSTVKRLVASGALPVVRVGKSPRIRVADIDRYLSGDLDDGADANVGSTVTSVKASSKPLSTSLPEGA